MRLKNRLSTYPKEPRKDLRDLVRVSAENFPDKVLYAYKKNKQEYTCTYAEFYQGINDLGSAFKAMGLEGAHIAVIGETHPYYTMTYFATIGGNGVIIPLDREISEEQIINFLEFSDAEAVVYSDKFNDLFARECDGLSKIRAFIPMFPAEDTLKDERFTAFEDVLKKGRAIMESGDTSFTETELDLEKLAAIIFTSGTTSTSKGVMLSHRNLISAANASVATMAHYNDDNRFVSVLPIHHTYDMTCEQLGIITLGASQLVNDSLKHTMKNFSSFKPTGLVLVPLFLETMHRKIWEEIRRRGMEKKVRFAMKLNAALLAVGIDMRKKLFGQVTAAFGGELESIVCGGAPISPDIILDFYHFGITVLEGYGITECSPLVAVNRAGQTKLGSVGLPVPGVTVKIDKTEGEETGEILVKGPNVMLGYYKNEEITKEVFTDDGYFRTGDIGYLDKDGYLFITGRKKNIILLSNGKNIFPEEIEEYVRKIPGVLENVVVGRTPEGGTTAITAIIVPDMQHEAVKDMDAEALHAYFKEKIHETNKHLPLYKRIGDLEIRMEEFEKNTSRKIKRFLIK